ncbi:helix-turn-helix domain-containing protein [Nocardiopsis rhodophaea]|uniref:helix-turn-helix domain-containing protein n=2 Tax=Nocardiopsis rhodophaea TaxID=280238 RepID=UPI0031E379D2
MPRPLGRAGIRFPAQRDKGSRTAPGAVRRPPRAASVSHLSCSFARLADMPTQQTEQDTGSARYTYRLRLSATAHRALLKEWGRCRWVWNQCVAESKQAHAYNRTRPGTSPRVVDISDN